MMKEDSMTGWHVAKRSRRSEVITDWNRKLYELKWQLKQSLAICEAPIKRSFVYFDRVFTTGPHF